MFGNVERPTSFISSEQKVTQTLDLGISAVLDSWRKSDQKLNLADITLPSGRVLSQIPKKHARLAIKGGINAGEMVFVITSTLTFPPDQLFHASWLNLPYQSHQGKLVAGIFPTDILERCEHKGVDITTVIEDCLTQVIKKDISLKYSEHSIGKYFTSGKVFKAVI